MTFKNNFPAELVAAFISLFFLLPALHEKEEKVAAIEKERTEKLDVLENKKALVGMTSSEKVEAVSTKLKITAQDLLEINGVMIPLKFEGTLENHEKETVTFALQSAFKQHPFVVHDGVYPGQSNRDAMARILKIKDLQGYEKATHGGIIPEFIVSGLSGVEEGGVIFLKVGQEISKRFLDRGKIASRDQRQELDEFIQKLFKEGEGMFMRFDRLESAVTNKIAKRGSISGKTVSLKERDKMIPSKNSKYHNGTVVESWDRAVERSVSSLAKYHGNYNSIIGDTVPKAEDCTSYSKVNIQSLSGRKREGLLVKSFIESGQRLGTAHNGLTLLYDKGRWWILVTDLDD